MTNKIIIDGIDIIECQYFDLSENYECYCNHRACKDCPNCYYKQLKRKEQECENLKEINQEIRESEIELENMKNSLFIDYMKYKQALDEIEEVCKDGVYDEYRRPLDECSVILNIINKVKEQ